MDKKIFKGIISVLSGSIFTILIGFIYNPLLVRLTGKNLYGEIANLLAIFGILSVISQLGMFDAIRKFVSGNLNNKEKLKEVVSSALFLSIFISILFIIIMAFTFNIVVKFSFLSNLMFRDYIVLLLSLLPLNIWTASKAILFSFHKETKSVKLDVLYQIFHKVLVLIFIYYKIGIFALPLSYLISNLFCAIVGFILVIKLVDINILNFNNSITKNGLPIVKFGLLSTFGILSAQLLYKSDIILTNYFLGSEETAIYNAALVLAEMLWLVPKAVQSILFHNSSELWGQNDKNSIINLGNKLLIYTTLVLILFGVGLLVLAKPFVTLYFGVEYVGAVTPLRILILGSFLFGIARIFSSILAGTEWLKIPQAVTFIAAISNIGLNIILIPRFGINGAAIATSFTYGMMLLGNLAAMKLYRVELKFSFPFLKIVSLLFLFYFIYSNVFNFLNINGIIDLSLMALFGLILFSGLVFNLGLIPKNEVKLVKNITKFKEI